MISGASPEAYGAPVVFPTSQMNSPPTVSPEETTSLLSNVPSKKLVLEIPDGVVPKADSLLNPRASSIKFELNLT